MVDEISFDGVMRTLKDYCFVDVQPATKLWNMHACVHDWTLAGLNKDIDTRLYWYAFDCVSTFIHEQDWKSFNHLSYARVCAHATRLVHHRFRCDNLKDIIPARLGNALDIGQLLREQVQLTAAEQMYLRALAGYEKALGPDHTSALNTVNNLGNLYKNEGKLIEAERMYLRALAGSEIVLGPDHTSTLDTVNNLRILYTKYGEPTDIIQLLSTWGRKIVNLYGLLGRSLLRNSDDSNAKLAFQQELVLQDGSMIFANIVCDNCGCSVSCATSRYVCKCCLDSDAAKFTHPWIFGPDPVPPTFFPRTMIVEWKHVVLLLWRPTEALGALFAGLVCACQQLDASSYAHRKFVLSCYSVLGGYRRNPRHRIPCDWWVVPFHLRTKVECRQEMFTTWKSERVDLMDGLIQGFRSAKTCTAISSPHFGLWRIPDRHEEGHYW